MTMEATPVESQVTSVEQTPLDQLRLGLGELFGAERRLRGREQQRAQELTHSQFRALTVLSKADEVTAGELARSADLNPASVTAMLDHLEADGVVQRRRGSPTDRRLCMVSLTDKGRDLLDRKRADWHSRWERHVGHLPEEDLTAALGVMRTIVELLDAI